MGFQWALSLPTHSFIALVHEDDVVAEPGLDERPNRLDFLSPDCIGELLHHLLVVEPPQIPSLLA